MYFGEILDAIDRQQDRKNSEESSGIHDRVKDIFISFRSSWRFCANLVMSNRQYHCSQAVSDVVGGRNESVSLGATCSITYEGSERQIYRFDLSNS